MLRRRGAPDMQEYAKGRIKALGPERQGHVRINKAGCLDRCEEGPVLVVYPDAVWYTYVDRDDIDEIIDRHIVQRRNRRAADDLTPRTTERLTIDGPAGRARGRLQRAGSAAGRHRAGRASASAAGRHARQQGRADAGQDVLRAGLCRRALQFPRRRRLGRRRSTTASARPTTRSWCSRMPRRSSATHCRSCSRDSRSDRSCRRASRKARGRAAPRAGRSRRAPLRRGGSSRGHDRHARRRGRRRAARRRLRVGAAAGAARSSCFPAAAISSMAACRSCSA